MKNRPQSETLGALVEELATHSPDAPALTFAGTTHSFAQMRAQILTAAKALHASGVRAGDKVGLLLGNCTEWVVLDFAIQYLGATMVGLNTWYTGKELSYVLDHADISFLFFADRVIKTDYVELFEALGGLSSAFPKVRQAVMLGARRMPGTLSWDEFIASGSSVDDATIFAELAKVSPDDMAYLLYTSGSTSRPKGVMLIHRHLIENTYQINRRLHVEADDVIYMPLSLFWGMGCMNMLIGPWTRGAHIVLQAQFDAREGLELIDRYRCTTFSATANIVQAVFNHPDAGKYDLTSVRKGTPLGTPEVVHMLIETIMPMGMQIYGLTETHGLVTLADADDPVEKRAETEGRPTPGWEVRIVDPDTGKVLKPGEVGEIRLKGRMTIGYYKDPAATAAAFDEQGFFKTGDRGRLDAEGFLKFLGRFKEMLKTGGINVAPLEVEEVLLTHPAISEAYITGVPDEVAGEIIAAVVVLKHPGGLTEKELVAFCQNRMAKYKIPRLVRFVEAEQVPLTTTTKVHRARLPELFEEA